MTIENKQHQHERMRLGISITPLFTLTGQTKKYDGIGSYTFNLIEAIRDQIEVHPVYFKTINESFKRPLPLTKPNDIFTIAMNPFINQYLPFDCYAKYEESIDVFHSTDYKVPKLKNTPVVATLHDAIPFKEAEHSNSKLRHLKNYLLKKVAANADHVITISHAMRGEIHQYFNIPHEKISVVHHGINAAWLKPVTEPASVLKKYQLEKPFLLVVGTISPKKNCLRIMQAFSKLPQNLQKDVQLLFVGRRGWDCEKEIQSLLKMQADGQAKWLEYVTFEDLRAIYQASIAVIFPSLNEGFGFPIIEAFASNTPVLTSNIGATAEIAADAGLLVDPLNIDEIMQGMQNLILDKALRQTLIFKGKERTKHFTVAEFAEKTMAVYKKVI